MCYIIKSIQYGLVILFVPHGMKFVVELRIWYCIHYLKLLKLIFHLLFFLADENKENLKTHLYATEVDIPSINCPPQIICEIEINNIRDKNN
jgi:hypothetical protein